LEEYFPKGGGLFRIKMQTPRSDSGVFANKKRREKNEKKRGKMNETHRVPTSYKKDFKKKSDKILKEYEVQKSLQIFSKQSPCLYFFPKSWYNMRNEIF